MPENSVNASAQARATEDDALQSQMCRVCPRTASSEGGPEADLSEKVVLFDNSAVRGDSSEALPAPISLVSEIMLMDVDQERRPAAHLGTRPSLTLHRGSRGATAEGGVVPGG